MELQTNTYRLQSVHNVNEFIDIIIKLSQEYLAICDTNIIPFSYAGS